jgi:hypothetical protein
VNTPLRRDPVSEVFEAIAAARRAAPADGAGACQVSVRSRTGQLLATFLLGSRAQVLAFAERVRPLGYRMAPGDRDGGAGYDFSLERRAANETIDPPRRRRGE